jgi:hypothetical protein
MDIISAILAITPDAQVSVNAEDYDQIIWRDGTAVISKADIVAKQAELKADYDSKEYQRTRAKSYPSLSDQLDMQYWDSVNDTTTWKDAVAKVKSDNPKA